MSRHKNYKHKCCICKYWIDSQGHKGFLTLRPSNGYCEYWNNPRRSNQHGCIKFVTY